MLKISTVDFPTERRLVLEGTLIEPWTEELSRAWAAAKTGPDNRSLIIDVENVTAISPEGESELLRLMKEGAKFRSSGVLTSYILRELARKGRRRTGKVAVAVRPAAERAKDLPHASKSGHGPRRRNDTRAQDDDGVSEFRRRANHASSGITTVVETTPGHEQDSGSNGHDDRKSNGKHEKRWWLKWLIFALLILAGGLVFLVRHHITGGVPQSSHEAGVPINTATATLGSITSYLEAIGTVTPVYTVTINSQITASISRVRYREGEYVERGAPLVDMDDRPFVAQLEQAQGALFRDQNLLAQGQMNLARYKESWALNGISRQTLEDQEKLVLQYEGTVKADEGAVRYDQTQVEFCHIASPIAGRVGLRLVDPGNLAVANSTAPLLVIAQTEPTTVVFTVAQDNLGAVRDQMRRGIKIPVEVWDRQMSKQLETGTLLTIDNQIDTTTGTVKARALFDNKNNALFPNQFVNTRLPVATLQKQILVPTSAVQYNGETSFVYVIKNNRAVLTNVKTGASSAGLTAVEGIQPGDVVANSSFQKLQNGSEVTVTAQPIAAPSSTGISAP